MFGEIAKGIWNTASDVGKAAYSGAASVAKASLDAGKTALEVVSDTTVAVAKAAGNVASFGGRALVDTADKAIHLPVTLVTDVYRAAKNKLSADPEPSDTEPCPVSCKAKMKRKKERQRLISDYRVEAARHPKDSKTRKKMEARADRFARNNEAIELARLSNDAYAQSHPESESSLPPCWEVVAAKDLPGIPPALLNDAKAVIYKTPEDWPGGQKTVLAFRGTDDLDDAVVDHDQAMALPTLQYQSSVELGRAMRKQMGPDVLVTGHSLGGGKAQAAGVSGGLPGTMFNSAGLHPDTVPGKTAKPGQFTQYRTPCDPLTGVQNSPSLQVGAGAVATLATLGGVLVKAGDAVAGLFGKGLSDENADYADKAAKVVPRGVRNVLDNGDLMPPALGDVVEVPAINNKGNDIPCLNPLGQHSMPNVINGIEAQKTEDEQAMKQ